MTQNRRQLFHQKTESGTIEVWQSAAMRSLLIGSTEQSRIDINHPEAVVSPVDVAILSVLLFDDSPQSVLLAGLGGGALARFLHHHAPDITGDAIEIDPQVAGLARQFFQFPESNWNLNITDIRRWQGAQKYDLIILDIGEDESSPDWLTSSVFLGGLKRQLTANGILVIDLLPADAEHFRNQLASIRSIFERRTLCLSVPAHNNVIVFAFNGQAAQLTTEACEQRVARVQDRWGLTLQDAVDTLRRDNPENDATV